MAWMHQVAGPRLPMSWLNHGQAGGHLVASAPPPSAARRASLRSPCSSNVPGDQSVSPDPPRGLRKSTNSERMCSGESVRQVMTHCPASMKRQSFVPPLLKPPRQGKAEEGTGVDDRSLPSLSPRPSRAGKALWNPGAPPLSFSQGGRSSSPTDRLAGIRLTESVNSPRAPKDRSARSLSEVHCGRTSPPGVRLRPHVIGRRMQSSAGIPWRHMPVYSVWGTLRETGDNCGAESCRRILKTVNEYREKGSNAELVAGTSAAVSPVADASRSCPTERAHKKGVNTEYNTSESCPFHRDDASPQGRCVLLATPKKKLGRCVLPATPQKKMSATSPLTNSVRAAGTSVKTGDASSNRRSQAPTAERNAEARRDRFYQQDRKILEQATWPLSSIFSPGLSTRVLPSTPRSRLPLAMTVPRSSTSDISTEEIKMSSMRKRLTASGPLKP